MLSLPLGCAEIERGLQRYRGWYNTTRPRFALELRAPLTVHLTGPIIAEDIALGTSVHEVGG